MQSSSSDRLRIDLPLAQRLLDMPNPGQVYSRQILLRDAGTVCGSTGPSDSWLPQILPRGSWFFFPQSVLSARSQDLHSSRREFLSHTVPKKQLQVMEDRGNRPGIAEGCRQRLMAQVADRAAGGSRSRGANLSWVVGKVTMTRCFDCGTNDSSISWRLSRQI